MRTNMAKTIFPGMLLLLISMNGLPFLPVSAVGAETTTRQVAIDVKIADFTPGSVDYIEENYCRDKAVIPNDSYFESRGTWGQQYDDQWAIKRVGFTTGNDSAWNVTDGSSNPVTVAVIDTGLDWNHQDIDWRNIWKNEKEIPDNGIDDDRNGYVDDVIGWNFIDSSNKPWDEDGHGTFVAGIIAATANNGVGIAGLNRGARIMVLKALNDFGHTRASFLSEAIIYAANNGARIINISAGGKHLTRTEQDAVDYAYGKGAIIVVAAGNEALDTADYAPAGIRNVMTVASTDTADKRAGFSNWGQNVDIAAPGMDILSLRARRTDLMLGIPGIEYSPGLGYVGKDKRYYRASGTSFSAPIVAAVASLILSKNPDLTNAQVMRMIRQSAKDIEIPGWDQYTGYGLIEARAALNADPSFFIVSKIQKVTPVEENGAVFLEITGDAEASSFSSATVELGIGENPGTWDKIANLSGPVSGTRIGMIPATRFTSAGIWTVRLRTMDQSGAVRESRASVTIE